jgi:RND family efflux transporter MFP subunit
MQAATNLPELDVLFTVDGLSAAAARHSVTPALQAAWLQRSRAVIDLALATLAHDNFSASALALANQLAQTQGCSLVQLGWWQQAGCVVRCRSGVAWHDKRAATVRLAEQAMNEAVDGGRPLRLHAGDGTLAAPASRSAVAAYLRHASVAALAIVPLRWREQTVGALMFERDAPFSADDIDALEASALLLGPVLALAHHRDRSLIAHARERCAAALRATIDGSRPGLKLLAAATSAMLVLMCLLPATHRVTAPAVVEGEVQWSAVAPFPGFIRQAHVRAGDSVKRGQALVSLDDRELLLERGRWRADLEVALRKEREAMAAGQRVEQRLAAAQAAQANAQLELTLDKLQRLQITAPFDGVVVQGDLSQLQGAPVETGKALFELAPLSAWRVVLKVDERDVSFVQAGQTGEISLVSVSGEAFALQVKRITAMARAEDGRNHFRVEADALHHNERLRPGMEGVAKVEVGSRSLMWLMTHRLIDSVRLAWWEWWL